MIDAALTSETSVDIQLRTRQYIPEDSELQLLIMFSLYMSQKATSNFVTVVKKHAMKTGGEVEIKLHESLISAMDKCYLHAPSVLSTMIIRQDDAWAPTASR
jgi:hypothetical protein